jgi:F0F1-type ATP synthase assembly protein I
MTIASDIITGVLIGVGFVLVVSAIIALFGRW